MKVDVVNLSYGEAARLCNTGRFAELSERLVRGHADHGTIFISSAGNNGPALTTVGAPGASVDALISVGAYVNGNMCGDLYGMRAPAANAGGPESATTAASCTVFVARARDGRRLRRQRRGAGGAAGQYLDTAPAAAAHARHVDGGAEHRRRRRCLERGEGVRQKPAPDAVKRVLEATAAAARRGAV